VFNKNNLKLKIVLVFIVSLLFKPLWLFNNNDLGQPADDMYHWLHAATLAFDQDFDYSNDFNLQNATLNKYTNVPSSVPGTGYLSAPFVYIFSFFDDQEITESSEFRINPTKSFSYLGFFSGGLFYIISGFSLLKKLIFNNPNSGLIIFCAFIGTLVHFATTRFLMPHAIEFFLCACLVFLFENKKNIKFKYYEVFLLFTVFALISITRPSTFLYSIILIFIYRKRFKLDLSFLAVYVLCLSFFMGLYIKLSNYLYVENYMLLNTYGSDMDAYTSSFTFEQLTAGFIKIPNLFVSPSMGLIWSTPIIFLGLYGFFKEYFFNNKINIDSMFYFLYFGASVMPLLIWQGREVAYGQRLLVGIIPLCVVMASNNIHRSKFINYSLLPLSAFTYVGYLFFYSSKKLTLFKGSSLWGTEVGFVGENYYFELIKGITVFENIVSVTLRNIYSVNFFKYFQIKEYLKNNSLFDGISPEKINKFFEISNEYSELSSSYLLTATLVILIFSYLFTNIIIDVSSKDKSM